MQRARLQPFLVLTEKMEVTLIVLNLKQREGSKFGGDAKEEAKPLALRRLW